MVTVVSPAGVRVVYNEASYIRWGEKVGCNALYSGDPDRPSGRFIAAVPTDWAISFGRSCEVEHHGKPPAMTLSAAVGIVAAGVRNVEWCDRHKLVAIKRELQDFDARDQSWKETE